MLFVVASSKLGEAVGREVKAKLGSLFGVKAILATEPREFVVEDGVVVVPATGGCERVLESVITSTDKPVMIIALPNHNSLASAIEVYSVYRDRVCLRYTSLDHRAIEVVSKFIGICRLLSSRIRIGVVGGSSEWLLTSRREDVESLGFEVLDFKLDEILVHGTEGIYDVMRELVLKHDLSALTIRCFDLIELKTTPCLEVARLNEELPVGCEGDLNALATMLILRWITGRPCWMANVCRLKPLVLAHCTVPLSMVDRFELTTHAESGVGVAVRGFLKREVVTIAKYMDGKMLVMRGRITRNLREEGLCRTQVELDVEDEDFLVENSLGNHVVIAYGDHVKALFDFCKFKGIEVLSPYRLHHNSGAD